MAFERSVGTPDNRGSITKEKIRVIQREREQTAGRSKKPGGRVFQKKPVHMGL